MDDVTTRDAVCWILEKMGFKQIAEDIKQDDKNLDVYINYIKYRDRKNSELRDFINYYL